MGDATVENVAWSYEQPQAPVSGIQGLIAFYRERVDACYEVGDGG